MHTHIIGPKYLIYCVQSSLCSENISVIVSDNNSSIYTESEFIHQVRAINPSIIAVRQDSNLGYLKYLPW